MDFSVAHLWEQMGLFARLIVMAMAAMSVASLFVVFERIVSFGSSSAESMKFAAQLRPLVESGQLEKAAADAPKEKVGHLGRTLNAGLSAFKGAPSEREVAIDSVARALERQAAREVQTFKRGLGLLATVGSTAPFIGLLGTTMGIVNAFQHMAGGSTGLGTVSSGISEALVTTAFGLMVAIPAVMGFNFLQGWIDARAVDLSESSNELLDAVSRHYAKPPSAS